MPGGNGLSLRQDRLIDAVLEGDAESIAEAGRKVGYKHRQAAHRALTSVDAQRELARRKAESFDLVGAHARLTRDAFGQLDGKIDEPAKALQFLSVTRGLDLAGLQEQAAPEARTERHRSRAMLILAASKMSVIRACLRWPDRVPRFIECLERRLALTIE